MIRSALSSMRIIESGWVIEMSPRCSRGAEYGQAALPLVTNKPSSPWVLRCAIVGGKTDMRSRLGDYIVPQAGAFPLGFLIIRRATIWSPAHAHATSPEPAKSVAAPLFHKIFVENCAIEPKIIATADF